MREPQVPAYTAEQEEQNKLKRAYLDGYYKGCQDTQKDASRWVMCEDRLPKEKQNKNYKDFEYVLCATTFGDVRPFKFGTPIGWDEPHFWYGADGIMDKYVTHWMPLPEPPKEGEA